MCTWSHKFKHWFVLKSMLYITISTAFCQSKNSKYTELWWSVIKNSVNGKITSDLILKSMKNDAELKFCCFCTSVEKNDQNLCEFNKTFLHEKTWRKKKINDEKASTIYENIHIMSIYLLWASELDTSGLILGKAHNQAKHLKSSA